MQKGNFNRTSLPFPECIWLDLILHDHIEFSVLILCNESLLVVVSFLKPSPHAVLKKLIYNICMYLSAVRKLFRGILQSNISVFKHKNLTGTLQPFLK